MKFAKIKLIVSWFGMACLFYSCDLINPAEPIPSYLNISSVQFNSSIGSSSHKITDFYVNIDTRYQGAYPIPTNFPLLETGVHEMIFFPGVILNGTSNTRGVYPLYKPYTQTVTLVAGVPVEITPVIAYYDSVVCTWCEDFEDDAGHDFIESANSDTGMVHLKNSEPDIFEGTGSGAVYLNETRIHFKVETSNGYDLPIFGQSVYLEVNYKCNQQFIIGIISKEFNTTYDVPVIVINAKETWNKLYIELASVIQAYPNAIDYKIYIEGTKDTEVGAPAFYFDNFKLLHN
ncbi:MAG: hypothetical protein ACHQNT_07370 [Bacteroidia bacterium]